MNCPICNGTGRVRESHGGGTPEFIDCECQDETCTCDDCGRTAPLGDCRDVGGEFWMCQDCAERSDREVERSRLACHLNDIPPFMQGMPIELD